VRRFAPRPAGIGSAALLAWAALGCAGGPPTARTVEPVLGAGTLSRAWVGSGSILLELLLDGRPRRFEAESEPGPEAAGARPFGRTARLRPVEEARWEERAAGLEPAVVVPPSGWERFRNAILREIVPLEPGQGAVVSVADQNLYLVFADPERQRAVCLREPPPGWEFNRRYEVSELKEVCLRLFASFCDRSLDRCPPTVFQTRELGTGGFPFVCLIPSRADALAVVFAPRGPAPPRTKQVRQEVLSTLGLVSVLGSSHTISVVNHPLSAPTRLFLALRDSAETLVARADVRFRVFPELERVAIPPLSPEKRGMDLAAFERYLDREVSASTAPARLRFLIDGGEYFPRLKQAIQTARRSIHMRTYIFDNDDVALEVADLLKERSKSLEVCVLCDGVGTVGASALPPASVPLEPAETPPSILKYLKESSGVKVRVRSNTWLACDHQKCTGVDGELAFIGGMNIGREYRYEWHDMMVEVSGPLMSQLEKEFAKAWADSGPLGDLGELAARGEPAAAVGQEPGGSPVRLLLTRPERAEVFRAEMEAIRRSRGYLYLQNAYLADDQIVYEVCAARKRGVDARVIMPLRGDSGLMDRSNVVTINTFLHHGVRVFIYPRMTHVKAAVFDGWACLGSANLDQLSLKRNRELDLATSAPEPVVVLLERLFRKDMDDSLELTEPLPESFADQLVELIADEL
jgi:cardiolipin synthase